MSQYYGIVNYTIHRILFERLNLKHSLMQTNVNIVKQPLQDFFDGSVLLFFMTSIIKFLDYYKRKKSWPPAPHLRDGHTHRPQRRTRER